MPDTMLIFFNLGLPHPLFTATLRGRSPFYHWGGEGSGRGVTLGWTSPRAHGRAQFPTQDLGFCVFCSFRSITCIPQLSLDLGKTTGTPGKHNT